MGANQSSNGTGTASSNVAPAKTSYYELLGVERQATDDEIKKAYRRKALELHPDRNYGDVERATALFAEIQAAYEVLSDAQERAWYDAHEQVILNGGEPTDQDNYEESMGITSADEVTAMMRRFSRNVEFSDASTGFFGFLRETFEKLAKEETSAAYLQNLDIPDYPSFGHSNDDYEDVVRGFYAAWASFASVKSFSWKHKYRKSDADDRWTRRQIDKENARFADQARKEFNDAVRALVAFIRKRDPRYTPNTQTDDERAKAMRDAAKAQAARQRAANEAKMNEAVPEWATRREPDELEESEEEIEEEHFECMACHKTFKSEKQFDAHEKSKKHQKAVQALKKKMRKENAHLGLDDEFSSSGMATPVEYDEVEDLEDLGAPDDMNLNSKGDVIGEVVEEVENLSIATPEEEKVPTDNLGSGSPQPQATQEETALSDEAADDASDIGSDRDVGVLPGGTVSPNTEQAPKATKMGKAAQKRAKRAAQQAVDDQEELKLKCATCNSGFPSKTRLFQHIKDFDHAAPPSAAKKAAGKGAKSKKGR